MSVRAQPPISETELLARANALAGMRLGEIAQSMGLATPDNLLRDKGWCGQLLESVLGTTATNLSEPDFLELGIELKTIPIDEEGSPLESTYVTTVPLQCNTHLRWEQSNVFRKLQAVLWVPILSTKATPIAMRQVCTPILWRPCRQQAAIIQADWEELMDKVLLGGLASVSARMGTVLQIRPKAAHSKVVAIGVSETGENELTLPRGFYLRPQFTKSILLKNF